MSKPKEEKVLGPIESLRDEIQELPDTICKEEGQIQGFSNNISKIESELKEMELFTMRAITNETTQINGEIKKKHTNEVSREAELKKNLASRKEYNEARQSMNYSKNELAKAKLRLNYLNNRFSACKYLVKLYVSGLLKDV